MLSYTKSVAADTLYIKASGHFTYEDRAKIDELIEIFGASNSPNIEIDMSKVSSIDSSALGYLLLVRDAVGKKRQNLVLMNPSKGIKGVFRVSDFQKLFKIIDNNPEDDIKLD